MNRVWRQPLFSCKGEQARTRPRLTVDEPKTDPKPSITTKRSRSKRIPTSKLPHPRQELDQTSVPDRKAEDDVRGGYASGRDVEHG